MKRKPAMKLLPCPWCGMMPWLVETGSGLYHVMCQDREGIRCDVRPRTSFFGRKEDVIKAWNNRKVPK